MPKLTGREVAVVQCEKATGIVLTTARTPKLDTADADWVLIFESVEDARAFVSAVVRDRPDLECWIYRAGRQAVERYARP